MKLVHCGHVTRLPADSGGGAAMNGLWYYGQLHVSGYMVKTMDWLLKATPFLKKSTCFFILFPCCKKSIILNVKCKMQNVSRANVLNFLEQNIFATLF